MSVRQLSAVITRHMGNIKCRSEILRCECCDVLKPHIVLLLLLYVDGTEAM